jgi:hypothetical protein
MAATPAPAKEILEVEQNSRTRSSVPHFFDLVKDVQQLLVIVGEMVDDIGVVPEDAEVGSGGLHGGKAAHHFVGIGLALGIAVLGDAPDALDGGILSGQLFHHIHIGAVVQHGDGDHFHAKLLADGEMTVVAGSGAKPFDLVKLAPGGAAGRAEDPQAHHGVVHHVEAGASAGDHVVRGDLKDLGEQRPAGGDALQNAVIADVGLAVGQLFAFGEDRQHGLAQIQLGLRGLAPGHVQLEALGLAGVIASGQIAVQRFQRGAVSSQNVHDP